MGSMARLLAMAIPFALFSVPSPAFAVSATDLARVEAAPAPDAVLPPLLLLHLCGIDTQGRRVKNPSGIAFGGAVLALRRYRLDLPVRADLSAGEIVLMERWRPSAPLLASWLGLLALLALTVTLAYQPLGAFNAVAALSIGSTKALIVAAIFMELRHRGLRTLIFAGAGLFWLAILLWLGSMDFFTRT
jgi:cytochrome c oxidase subunit 4